VTEFERLARVPAPRTGLALLRCRLVTGRRHQIRVHLAARGWPIVGDPEYGDAPALSDSRLSTKRRVTGVEGRWSAIADPMLASALRAFPRQALHAWRLAIPHPITGEPMGIEAPIPRDMKELMTIANLQISTASERRSVSPGPEE
jgi:23S rRNA pseudouridine1911/1915/1917 synthase